MVTKGDPHHMLYAMGSPLCKVIHQKHIVKPKGQVSTDYYSL